MTDRDDSTGRADDVSARTANAPARTAIVSGPDENAIADALDGEGVDVTRLEDHPTQEALKTAGIADVDLYVFTDFVDATSVPIVRDLTDDVRIVAYASGSVPEFVRGQLDLAIDPRVMDARIVSEELAGTA